MTPRESKLSSEAERLLAHERNIVPAPSDLRARALARASLSAPLSNGRVETEPRWVSWRPRFAPLAAVGIVFGSVVAFAAWYEQEATPVVPVQPIATALVERIDALPKPRLRVEPAPPTLVEPSVRPEVGRPRAQGSSTTTPELDPLELVLLQRARSALGLTEPEAALNALAEHERRFPSGALREEREALRIRALEALGKKDEARRRSEEFREDYPRSVLTPQLGQGGHAP